MKKNISIWGILSCVLILMSSCWHEDLSNCWKGDVVIHLYAEDFQNITDHDSKNLFSDKVSSLGVLLYDRTSGNLVRTERLTDFASADSCYTLTFHGLPFGDYVLVTEANADYFLEQASHWDSLVMKQPESSRFDYLASLDSFTLDCECGYQDLFWMYRKNGRIQFTLHNVPLEISRVEAVADNLYAVGKADTTYQGNTDRMVSHSFEKQDDYVKSSFMMDAFPTASESGSSVTFRFYMNGAEGKEILAKTVFLDRKIRVPRNAMLGVTVDFENNLELKPDVEIVIDPTWDGVNDDGDVDIN